MNRRRKQFYSLPCEYSGMLDARHMSCWNMRHPQKCWGRAGQRSTIDGWRTCTRRCRSPCVWWWWAGPPRGSGRIRIFRSPRRRQFWVGESVRTAVMLPVFDDGYQALGDREDTRGWNYLTYFDPASSASVQPALSAASKAHSSSILCCGSTEVASSTVILKKGASKA